MKNNYFNTGFLLVGILFLMNAAVFGESLSPQTTAPLFEHLHHVNKEWSNQADISTNLLAFPIAFKNDDERIQLHLKLVERTLRARLHANLDKEQIKNRLHNLTSLQSYWQTGRFPKNTGHTGRQPYFIDNYGTACAVGHLLQTSGQEDFAEKVAEEQNFSFIEEIAHPKLSSWANENGFSKQELAWIQPTYQGTYCLVPEVITPNWTTNGFPMDIATQKIETMLTLPDQSMIIVGGNFNIDNQYRTVAGYDGVEWVGFGNSLIGTVYDIEYINGVVYVAGDFNIQGTNFYNIAWWNGSGWQGLQTGQMGGVIRDIKQFRCQLYAAGDFTTVNGASMNYLAAWNGNSWTQSPVNCTGGVSSTLMTVDGKVNALEIYNGALAIGGTFTNAGSSTTINNLEGFAFWTGTSWYKPSLSGTLTFVDNMVVHQNLLMIGGDDLVAFEPASWYYGGDLLSLGPVSTNMPYYSGRTTSMYSSSGSSNPGQFVYSVGNTTHARFSQSNTEDEDFDTTVGGSVPAYAELNDVKYLGGNFESGSITNFSEGYFFLCSNLFAGAKLVRFDVVLPIELNDFETSLEENQTISLDWSTLSEQSLSHFEIERRLEQEPSFSKVGELNAEGESTSLTLYHFTDDLSRVHTTQVYYRLKIVDMDGSFQYSETRTEKLSLRDIELTVYPNPTTEAVTIEVKNLTEGTVTINLYSLQGTLLHSEMTYYSANSFVQERLLLDDLTTGLYLVEVITPSNRGTKKLKVFK